MIYGSICSGIESATIAWEPLGWKPAFFSEIEAAPRAVLTHHWPEVPLHGDFTTIKKRDYQPIDLLVGGTPCQDFSVAGLRKGIAGDRGCLTIEFVHLLKRLQPRWFVFENVPGILSSDKGRAFGIFLGLLGKCGYGFAYRILDAQHFGIPQRRRRVFVVGYLGNWRPAAAVLFERESLRGDPPPRRETGEDVAPTITNRSGRNGENDFNTSGGLVSGTLNARNKGGGGLGTDFECMGGLTAHTLSTEGFDASEDGTGRGIPLVAGCLQERDAKGADSDTKPGHLIAFDCKGSEVENRAEGQSPTLRAMGGKKQNGGGQLAVAMNLRGRDGGAMPEMCDAASLRSPSGGSSRSYVAETAVRRLTPIECERLQGLPDNHTLVPFGKKMMADGPRYRMIGNSMARPCMFKIGQRIDLIRKLMEE